jgi:serine/threonine protein kinase
MAPSFKIPTSLERKAKKETRVAKVRVETFRKRMKLGCCTFGSVYLGKYKGRREKVVTKKNNVESIDSKSCFVKEAALLNSTKGHRNIIRFLGFCEEQYSIMMEYSCFDFRRLELQKAFAL